MSAEAAAPPTAVAAPTRRRRWRRRLLGLVVLLAAAAWFAPAVVARTGLPNRLARQALPEFKGTIEVGGTSLGWLSVVELRAVTVKDARGRVLLTAPKITSSKSLLALARDRSDLGEFVVERPAVSVVCEKRTTNLEEALADLLKDDGSPKGPTRPAVAVRVTDGTLTIHDAEAGTSAEVGGVAASVVVPTARSEPVIVKLSAASPGKLDAELSVGAAGSVVVKAAEFPGGVAAPFVDRLAPGVAVGGRFTTDITARWGTDSGGRPTASVTGTVVARDLHFAGPWLNGDRLRLASAELSVKLEAVGRAVRVERAELTCDAGTASASGGFDPDVPLDELLEAGGLTVAADVDLAKLAGLAPKALRLRPGTEVREGRLTLRVEGKPSPAGTAWGGSIRTSALKAVRAGRPVEWPEPLAVEFAGRLKAGGLPTFDKFVCKSDFLAVNAQGSAESFRAAANVYLDRLAARLGEFADLGGVQLAGEASAWVSASRGAAGEFKAEAGAELKQFAYADPAKHTLAEPALALKASAAGVWPKGGAVRIDTGTLTATAGADRLDLKLLDAIPDARIPAAGTLSAALSGDLSRWVGRARGFVNVPKHYVFGGAVTVTGTVRIGPVVAVDRLHVRVDQARFRGAGLDLDEPTLTAAGDLTVNTSAGVADSANLQLTSPTLTVTAGAMRFEGLAGGPPAVSGSGQAVADLARLGRTVRLSTDPKGSDAFRGRGTGPVRFRWQGDTTTFGGSLAVTNFAYGNPQQTGLEEPSLTVELDGRYDLTPDKLTLNAAKVSRPGLTANTKGTVAKFGQTPDVVLDGTLSYDLAALTPELRKAVGGNFTATGKGTRPFRVSGRLTGRDLAIDAGVGWDAVKVYGFDAGRGDLSVKLADGAGTVSPVSATFGGGRITLTPTLKLDPQPAEVSFAKGKVVDRAKLNPEVTAGALGYALPVLARSANPVGEVSVVLDDNRVPLADFGKATMKGQVLVHKATVSAGPVVSEVLKLLGQPPATLTLANEMAVPVKVENGRVYHENLALTVNGYAVKTTGSVGLDGSLALVADVPVPGTFPGLKNNPSLKKAVEGKVVKVPIGGTLGQPAVDHKGFERAVAELARGAVKDVVRDKGKELLRKELDKLLPGMKK